ncbi:hypothetical protein J8J27_33345, partial [Mycobacterium tuberculosis]|nr:hypothetical protein [Mycobacterium tuberculosis]
TVPGGAPRATDAAPPPGSAPAQGPASGTPPILPPVAQAGPSVGAVTPPPQQQPVPMVAQRVSMMEENPVAGSQPLFSTGKV